MIDLNKHDVALMRWCIKVAIDSLTVSHEDQIDSNDAVGIIYTLDQLDEKIFNQAKEQFGEKL
jgi:hypothetical protein